MIYIHTAKTNIFIHNKTKLEPDCLFTILLKNEKNSK